MMTTTGRPRSSAAARPRAIVTLRACQASTIPGTRASGQEAAMALAYRSRNGRLALGIGGQCGTEHRAAWPRGSEAIARDAPRHRRLQVERDHRQAGVPGELEQRPVHREIRPPAGAPAQALLEVAGCCRLGDGPARERLLALVEHLEADG